MIAEEAYRIETEEATNPWNNVGARAKLRWASHAVEPLLPWHSVVTSIPVFCQGPRSHLTGGLMME